MSDQNSRYMLDNLNVLVIDDNRHMRSLVQSILHALGVKNVTEAGDAAQAFKELQHFNADVIIADWHMEPLDGLDFVRLVRTAKDSPNPYVPIIMLSGYTEYRRVTEARDAGINEFLAKPISAKALYLRFASIIDNPRPFVRTKSYFGPDRRRQNLGPPRGSDERRKDAKASKGTTDSIGAAGSGAAGPDATDNGGSDAADSNGLSSGEVENLMNS